MDRLEAVKARGAVFSYDQIWSGTAGVDRASRDNPDHITGVMLPLSDQEWCFICMRERNGYVGGCCANTSAMQDIINSAFRDGGSVDDGHFLKLGLTAREHDGFEMFQKMDDDEFEKYISRWDVLDPWDKMGLVFLAVEEKLYWTSYERGYAGDFPEEKPEQKAFWLLEHGLQSLAWDDLFSDSGDSKRECQRRANTIAKQARILQPAIMVAEQLKQNIDVFEGYGIINKETGEVIRNGGGYCIYGTEEDAVETLEMMTRWEREEREMGDDPIRREDQMIADKVLIGPVHVSTQQGILTLVEK